MSNIVKNQGCSEACWTPVVCPDHNSNMNPRGRDAGSYAYYCCDNYQDPTINPRHLFNEHDSTRWYTDKEGWNKHEKDCETCNNYDE